MGCRFLFYVFKIIGNIGIILGLYWDRIILGISILRYVDDGSENGNYRDRRDYIGIIWGLCRGYRECMCYMGILEKKMETTLMGYIGSLEVITYYNENT